MGRYYILKGRAEVPVDHMEWAEWYERNFNTNNRIVAQTKIGDQVFISTVFLGLDHSLGLGPPQIYETLVQGSTLDDSMDRYSTWAEAEIGHRRMVRAVIRAMKIKEKDLITEVMNRIDSKQKKMIFDPMAIRKIILKKGDG